MNNFLNVYGESMAISLVIIISFIFNKIAKKTNVPSVLMLIALGVGLKFLLVSVGMEKLPASTFNLMELLGVVGLIMIVLEASLELKLSREKMPLLIKSFLTAFFAFTLTALAIAGLLYNYMIPNFEHALAYAIPPAILSSAIVIPSIGILKGVKKEFLIYESTFSDIIGIMFFYFLPAGKKIESGASFALDIGSGVLLTIVISVVVSYLLVILFRNLNAHIKLFFLIALLIFLYAAGKLMHLSSLMIIMVFGLVLNNVEVFFRGKLKRFAEPHSIESIKAEFHTVTAESAFVVRTFFFVLFGLTLNFAGLTDPIVLLWGGGITLISLFIRFVFLKLTMGKNLFPLGWIAPRGLITILLYFSIPEVYKEEAFRPSVLLVIILLTNFLMTGALIVKANAEEISEEDRLRFNDWEKLDAQIARLQSAKPTEES